MCSASASSGAIDSRVTERRPAVANLARLSQVDVSLNGHSYSLPHFYREGHSGPPILFVHGLGGAKENFYAALQSPALAHCTLVAFDLPGTGLAAYDPAHNLDVSSLAEIATTVADRLIGAPYWLAGASMGGLIALLMIRKNGTDRISGLVNLEGNLLPEDCMFSRRVVSCAPEEFSALYERMIRELANSRYLGDQIIAQNMAYNVDDRAYRAYSFQTVEESDSNILIEEFIRTNVPKLFLYGSKNESLSYLPRLRSSGVQVCEIPTSAHFFFYDNPAVTYRTIGEFVDRHSS